MEPTTVVKSRLATPHPTGELLESYALGRLSEPELENVETHLFVCHACQDALIEADEYTAAMKAALAEPIPQTAASWPTRVAAFGGHLIDSLRLNQPVPAFTAALAALSLAAMLSQSFAPAAREAEVTLLSVRGSVDTTQARGPADARLTLKIQSRQLNTGQDYQARIFDAAGKPAWAGAPQSNGENGGDNGHVLRVDNPLPAGTYWVRLYDAHQKLLQEYGLELQ